MRLRHLLLIGLVCALATAGLLTCHTVRHIIRVHLRHEPLRPWMSIPYIARLHHVPATVLYQSVGLPSDHRDHRPIGWIARTQGRPVRDLIAGLEAAIAKAHPKRTAHPQQGAP